MSRIRIRREAPPPVSEERPEQALRRQTAWAAGTEDFRHRDPLYHVTESFQQTFDAVGQRHAAEWAGEAEGQKTPAGDRQELDKTSAKGFYEGRSGEPELLRRFSETAFQRGTLSGAVLQGTGRMMLFSCLKKAVGQSQPDKWQQRKLFQGLAARRNVPGGGPDRVSFSRGFAYSAVGLVVDTLKDARRTVEELRELALGCAGLEGSGAETLRTMYPFLDDSRERTLLEQYRDRLRTESGPEARGALQNAIVRLEGLRAKKAQMKEEFINKLRFLSDRAAEALKELEAPELPGALDAALRQAAGAPEPPPGGGEEGAGGTEGNAEASPAGAASPRSGGGAPVPEGPPSGGPDGPGPAGGCPAGAAGAQEPERPGGVDGQQRPAGRAGGPEPPA